MPRDSFFSRKLKDLDTFKRIPKEVTKGSLLGVLCRQPTPLLTPSDDFYLLSDQPHAHERGLPLLLQ